MKFRFAFFVLLLLLPGSRANAWGGSGHSYLTQQSVQHLPAPLQAFVNEHFTTIHLNASTEPPGQHYIDIDNYDEFHDGVMPRNLNVLYAKYGTSFVNSNGISPWVIANYRTTLTAQMIAADDYNDFEALAETAGEMAHYLEDINQPLHTTENHNGQLSGNTGIHSRYESNMIDRHFNDLGIVAAPQNVVYVSDTVDWVLDSIETRTYAYVDDILAADTLARTFGSTSSNAYYNSLWNSTGAFTHTQFQIATEMIASAWYSAWIDAGSPALGTYGDYNGDEMVDAADYVAWRKNDNVQGSYEVWRETFGLSTAQSGAGFVLVPEPPVYCLLAIAAAFVVATRRTAKSRWARGTY